jgi:hypothetical protein
MIWNERKGGAKKKETEKRRMCRGRRGKIKGE